MEENAKQTYDIEQHVKYRLVYELSSFKREEKS